MIRRYRVIAQVKKLFKLSKSRDQQGVQNWLDEVVAKFTPQTVEHFVVPQLQSVMYADPAAFGWFLKQVPPDHPFAQIAQRELAKDAEYLNNTE